MRTKVHVHTHTFYPDAQADYDRLKAEEKRLTRAKASRAREFADEDGDEPPRRRRMSEPVEDIDAELANVRAEMAAAAEIIDSGKVWITLKGLTRGEFRRLLTEHPPRDGDKIDESLGYNGDTFLDAFVSSAIIGTHDAHGEPVENQWDVWGDEMTKGQWDEILAVCTRLTNGGEPTALPR